MPMAKPSKLGYYKPIKPNTRAWPIKRLPGNRKEVPNRGRKS